MLAITNSKEISEAYNRFMRLVTEGAVGFDRMVGHLGDSWAAEFFWHPDLQLWVVSQATRCDNRYWCAFGIDDPEPVSLLSITCEINSPKNGINRRCAGLFVRDESGHEHLAHSGKVGGGRAGIGKTTFLERWEKNDVESVHFPDGKNCDYIILGRIDDPNLLRRLSDFVHAVARIKEETAIVA